MQIPSLLPGLLEYKGRHSLACALSLVILPVWMDRCAGQVTRDVPVVTSVLGLIIDKHTTMPVFLRRY